MDEPRRQTTLRLTAAELKRVKQVALDLDTTVLELIKAGLNRVFVENGYEPLDPASPIAPPAKKHRRP